MAYFPTDSCLTEQAQYKLSKSRLLSINGHHHKINHFLTIGLPRPWLEHTIYITRGEFANHCTSDVVTNIIDTKQATSKVFLTFTSPNTQYKLSKSRLLSINGHHHKINELQPISPWHCWKIPHFYVKEQPLTRSPIPKLQHIDICQMILSEITDIDPLDLD
jgi:hypothetical protein